MVLAADATATHESLVISTVGDSYARAGSTVVDAPFDAVTGVHGVPGHAVVAAEAGVVECVIDAEIDPADLAPGIVRLAADGWAVTVLVPAHRIGQAHSALRRRPARLQPWWLEDGVNVRFGALEVP